MNWIKSKTLWFNLIVAVLGIIEMNMMVLQPYLGEHYGIVFMIIAIVNVVLRTVTTTSLKDK